MGSNLDQVKAITQPIADGLAALTDQVQVIVTNLDTDIVPKLNDAWAALGRLETTLAAMLDEKMGTISIQSDSIQAMGKQIDDLKAQLAALPVPVAPSSIPAGGFSLVLHNMTEIQPGVFRSTNLGATKAAGGQVAVAQARLHTPAQPGQTVVLSYDQTTNVIPDGTKNIKDSRAWPSPTTPYPNHYTGRTFGSGDNSLTAENNDGVVLYHGSHPTGWNVGYFHMPLKADVKQRIEQTIRFASAPGLADGYAKIAVDGVTVFESEGFLVNGPREDFGAQIVYAPIAGDSGPLPAGSYLQVENLTVKVL